MTMTAQEVVDAIARGEMTGKQAFAMFQAEADAAHPPYTPPPKLPDITATGMSASQLAVRSLVASGKSEIEALRDLAEWGPEAYAAEITAEAERVVGLLTAQKDADFLLTAEGRVFTAEKIEAERAQATRTLALAKTLLSDAGISDDDMTMLTDAEIIAESGIEGRAEEFGDGADSMSANLAAMAASNPRGGEAA